MRGPPPNVQRDYPSDFCHPASIREAYGRLPKALKERWIWWNLPAPPRRTLTLKDLIEDIPNGVDWHSSEQTKHLLSLMSDVNLQKVRKAKAFGSRVVGTIYRRTRPDSEGQKLQRAEVRFDDISGCLRTPAGGSSRQIILVVDGKSIRSRLLSPREAARLMGVPETYPLPENYNEAYHLFGDGLAVPVVSWLNDQILHPIVASQVSTRAA